MFLASLILISALSISCIAIYFSIIGLTTIFPGAFWPIVIMGSVLETGKLVCASWLHHNWKIAPRSLKIYLTTAVCVLIFITSMGIFGFLSKSHIEQQRDINQATTSLSQVELKIKNEENYITRQENLIAKIEKRDETSVGRTDFNIELEQKKIKDLQDSLSSSISYDEEEIGRLDSQLADLDKEIALLQASKGGLFSSKDKKIKELQEKQKPARASISQKKSAAEDRIKAARQKTAVSIDEIRKRMEAFQDTTDIKVVEDPKLKEYDTNIRSAYVRIEALQAAKFKEQEYLSNLEVEVGPIKYIAALVEDMGIENVVLGEAVRIVILILVFVFDPLAVVMLLAANMSFRMARGKSYEKLSTQIVAAPSKPASLPDPDPVPVVPPAEPPKPSNETKPKPKPKASPGIYHDL